MREGKKHPFAINVWRWGLLILLLVLWEIGARLKWIDPFFFSSPLKSPEPPSLSGRAARSGATLPIRAHQRSSASCWERSLGQWSGCCSGSRAPWRRSLNRG